MTPTPGYLDIFGHLLSLGAFERLLPVSLTPLLVFQGLGLVQKLVSGWGVLNVAQAWSEGGPGIPAVRRKEVAQRRGCQARATLGALYAPGGIFLQWIFATAVHLGLILGLTS